MPQPPPAETTAERPELELRLAVKQDLEQLTAVTNAAVKPNKDCELGFQLLYTPGKYQERLPKLMKLFTRNNCYTCIVAEATDEQGVKSILGYAVWGWVEYDKNGNDGNGAVRGGVLPKVKAIWDKYLPDCEKPTDPPQVKQGDATATPKYECEQLDWKTNDFFESWGVHFLHTDPAYDTQYVETELLRWGCNIADQEGILLRAAWPIDTADPFMRAGFLYSCVYLSELKDEGGTVQELPMMKLCRSPRARTPSGTESSSSSSSEEEEELNEHSSGVLPN